MTPPSHPNHPEPPPPPPIPYYEHTYARRAQSIQHSHSSVCHASCVSKWVYHTVLCWMSSCVIQSERAAINGVSRSHSHSYRWREHQTAIFGSDRRRLRISNRPGDALIYRKHQQEKAIEFFINGLPSWRQRQIRNVFPFANPPALLPPSHTQTHSCVYASVIYIYIYAVIEDELFGTAACVLILMVLRHSVWLIIFSL